MTGRLADATDAELMGRIQADDTAAFAALHARLAPKALRTAAMICATEDRARDAVQESFLSMWRGRARYRPESGEVQTWVLGIVRNRAIDGVRRDARHDRHRQDLEPVVDLLPAPGDVEADAVAGDDARRLRTMLAGLPITQREVVALAYFGQLSHTEIATELAVPVGTVKGRMRLGLSGLRDGLAY